MAHDDTTRLARVTDGGHDQAYRDLMDLVAAAQRHTLHWDTRPAAPTPEQSAEAHMHLGHAAGALERLVSAAEALRGELANALMAHQTDQADALLAVWDEAVGDRAYGIGVSDETR